MSEIISVVTSSDMLKNSPIVAVLICFSIAVFFGAKGIFAVLQKISESLTTIHTTLQILVEQGASTMKILDGQIDRLLKMVEEQLRSK